MGGLAARAALLGDRRIQRESVQGVAMFPGGTMKALTLSYDDGVEQDRRLVEILNRSGIKAAFNLNSGIQSGAGSFEKQGVTIRRMNIAELPTLYRGHEIGVHSLTHPHLELLDEATVENELGEDKINLERIFGVPIRGMAYPFGTYSEPVIEIARRLGLRYARGVKSTHAFDIPENLMIYQPTCHHKDPALMELAERFIELQPPVPQVFSLWGHSYEFELDNNWEIIEDFCRAIGGRKDIFYTTPEGALIPKPAP
jgi:peptidoglycan/xylan/chitin deacetylase (PgdA/CDA1 family)